VLGWLTCHDLSRSLEDQYVLFKCAHSVCTVNDFPLSLSVSMMELFYFSPLSGVVGNVSLRGYREVRGRAYRASRRVLHWRNESLLSAARLTVNVEAFLLRLARRGASAPFDPTDRGIHSRVDDRRRGKESQQ